MDKKARRDTARVNRQVRETVAGAEKRQTAKRESKQDRAKRIDAEHAIIARQAEAAGKNSLKLTMEKCAPAKKVRKKLAPKTGLSWQEAIPQVAAELDRQRPAPKRKVNASDYIRKDELGEYLKAHLKLEISTSSGGFTDPNGKDIVLKLDDTIISTAYINVRQTREYEG